MADTSGDDRPVVEYAAAPRTDRGQLVVGHAIGVATAVVLVVGCAVGGSYIDATVNRGEELAGLGGLLLGGAVGLGTVLVAALVSVQLGRRRHSPRLRGVGQGLLLSLALAGLCLGVCAVTAWA